MKAEGLAVTPGPREIGLAVEVLRDAGFIVIVNTRIQLCTVAETAKAIRVHPDWVTDNLERFPGARRLPGGHIRIPVEDILNFRKNSPV